MIEIVAGEKGIGKTKILINKVNDATKVTKGSIVYFDKNNKHIYELSNRIELINVTNYYLKNTDMFKGFLKGIILSTANIKKIYLDSLLTIAKLEINDLSDFINNFLTEISIEHNIDFVISIATSKDNLPDDIKELVIISL